MHRDINLKIEDGEFAVFAGPSAHRQVNCAAHDHRSRGRDRRPDLIDGEDLTHTKPSTRGLAKAFQSQSLFAHIPVRENLGLGLPIAKLPKDKTAEKVVIASGIPGLDDLLERKPREVSGGQQQRVAIGRAIVREPAHSCSTSRSPTSTRRCAFNCASRWCGCTSASRQR